MNPIKLFTVWVSMLGLLFCQSCNPSESSSDHEKNSSKTHATATSLIHEKQHGMLIPPEKKDLPAQITEKRISKSAIITDRHFPSGRYFDPIVTSNGLLAVACLRGLDIFDITQPSDLSLKTSLDTPGHAWSVVEVNGFLWIADGYAGVTLTDINGMSIYARWPQLTHARAFCRTSSNSVIVCRHSTGATLISAESHAEPEIIGEFPCEGKIFYACSEQNRVYLASMNGGYQAFDISAPQTPQKIWSFNGPQRILWCGKKNSHHFLLDRDRGIWVIEETNTTDTPSFVSLLTINDELRRASFCNDHSLLLAGKHSVYVIDISNPADLVITQNITLQNEGRGIVCDAGRVFVSDGDLGLKSYRFISPDSLDLMNQFNRYRLLTDVAVFNDFILSTNTTEGLNICKLDADQISPVSKFKNMNYALAVDTYDHYAVVADYSGIVLLDISDPHSPRFISQLKLSGRTSGICVYNQCAYVAAWFDGLQIVDLSRPEKLNILSKVSTEGWAIDVIADHGYAYLCAVNGGLFTIDVTDPKNPFITSKDTTSTAPEGAAITATTLYLADFNSGLLIYSLENRQNPKPIKWYPLDVCKGVKVSLNRMIVSNYIYGVKLFDISNERNPVMIGEFDTPGKAYEAAFCGNSSQLTIVADWHELLLLNWNNL